MKKVLSALILTLAALFGPLTPAFAQFQTSPYPAAVYYASAFGNWQINGNSPNTFSFYGSQTCNQSAQAIPFFVFSTNAPVRIVDSTTSNSQTVTPTSIIKSAGSCGFTASGNGLHNSFYVTSATGGLQEAVNTIGQTATKPAMIVLDRNWYANVAAAGGTASTVIAAIAGTSGAYLDDITTAPNTIYTWNGTAFGAIAGQTGGTVNPTPAAGAGAGTTPTIALASGSTPNIGTVNLTSGTSSPTSGTIFTLTWPTTGSFTYAPTCTVTSTGATQYTVGTTSVAYTASHAVLTFAVGASTALADSTAYKFRYSCQ